MVFLGSPLFCVSFHIIYFISTVQTVTPTLLKSVSSVATKTR